MSLTACLKYNLTEDSIEKRLKEEEYTVSYISSADETAGYISQNVSISTIISATKTVNDEAAENGVVFYFVKIFFCGNAASAKWVEEKLNAYNENPGYASDKNVIIYRYENVVMVGDYVSVSIARTY